MSWVLDVSILLSICRVCIYIMGRPHLMVTVTCNGFWPEIQQNLLPGQCAMDRPDLCNRVFKIKLKAIMRDLISKLIGKATNFFSVSSKNGVCRTHTSSSNLMVQVRRRVMKLRNGSGQTCPIKELPVVNCAKKSSSIWCTKSVVISIRTHRA